MTPTTKVVDYLFRALCQSEFYMVQIDDLACRIWMDAYVGNV
jgi:hypothetical protein